jgi:hypothetical protein
MADEWRTRFPKRTIHLDFHTGPDIPGVGSAFDADAFARTFADAHVDSVTVFAKCHHGHLYYRTDRPERHPSLPVGLDLLGEQVEALHAARIRAPIYMSVQCDEYAANAHQDWVALSPLLAQVRFPRLGPLEAAWQVLDMSSPYQDYLAEQLHEVLDRFAPVDGIFLDMCWDQPSLSRWARAGMAAEGLDPSRPDERDRYARLVAQRYMERFSRMVGPALLPGSSTGTWFNSRPKAEIALGRRDLRHIEVEALPTGGWGYSYLPYVARLVRRLGLPVLGMTGRFHRSWGDGASLKAAAALKYECCQMLVHGLSNGVGDLLAPSGAPDAAVYRRIGEVYEHVAACEPYLAGGEHLSEVALVIDPGQGDSPPDGVVGALRALQQLRHQFDVVARDAELHPYPLAVVPEGTPVDAALAGRLERYLEAGGALVIAAAAAASSSEGLDWLRREGVEVGEAWPFDPVFLGLARPGLLGPVPGTDVRVPGESLRVAGPTAEVLVELVLPWFQRTFSHFSGHSYTPPSGPSGYGAVVQQGRVVVLAAPVFSAVATERNPEYVQVLGACIERLLPAPLLRATGPAHLETAVVETAAGTAVHLLSFLPSRLGDDLDLVLDPFPLVEVRVSVRAGAAPGRAVLQPGGEVLDCAYDGRYASVNVSVAGGHAVLVFEK